MVALSGAFMVFSLHNGGRIHVLPVKFGRGRQNWGPIPLAQPKTATADVLLPPFYILAAERSPVF